MFKNLTIYKINNSFSIEIEDAVKAAEATTFVPCMPTQAVSVGWVPPRGEEHGAMVEALGEDILLRFMTETKVVPGAAIADFVQKKCDAIFLEDGCRVGKSERRELKKEALLTLLPLAFTRRRATGVWIDLKNMRIVIDTASQGVADTVITILVNTFPNLAVTLLNTKVSARSWMTDLLVNGETAWALRFQYERDCELVSEDDAKSVIRYSRCSLETEEIREHIRFGKLPSKLALSWDDKISFVLTDNGSVRRVSFDDVTFEKSDEDDNKFDADFAIMTGGLSPMINDLIEVLGGSI